MFNGDWFKRYSTALIAVAILAVLGLGGTASFKYGSERQAEYERYADNRRREYTANTYSPERQRCFRLAAGFQHNCVTEAKEEYDDYHREQQDLVAQRVTALWTKLMGGAAIVGMVLSAFGVFLVWTTFNATRDGNVISKRTGEAQVRAYLMATGGLFQILPTLIYFQPKFKNSGNSPAKSITFKVKARLVRLPKTKSNPDGQWVSPELDGSCDDIASDSEIVGAAKLSPANGQIQSFIDAKHFYLDGTVTWFDVFGTPQDISFSLIANPLEWIDWDGQQALVGRLSPVMNRGNSFAFEKE